MKKVLSWLLVLAMLLSVMPAVALAADVIASGTCGDNLTWTFDSTGVLTISGTGDMYDYSISPRASWYPHIDKINVVKVEEGVTGIGSYAFYKHKHLYKVYLPSTLKKINDSAFQDANYIDSVYTPSLESWLSISFGSSTSSNPMYYGRYLYIDGDDSITDVVVPESITTIHRYAFINWKITSLTLHEGVTTIESSAFYNSGSNIKTAGPIGSGCDYEFPWTDEIPDYAFQYMSGLTDVIIPDTVERIGNSAFFNCALTEITIPDRVTSVGFSAFKYCGNLTTVTLSDNVTSIGDGAFDDCDNLQAVYAGPLENWLGISFGSATSNPMHRADVLYLDGEQPVNVVIPDDVTAIGDYTFYDCDGITNVVIPDSVTSVGACAFYDCDSLLNVDLGDTVSEIGAAAFGTCNNLTSIDIPDSVVSIGESAFSYCKNLASIRLGKGVQTIGTNAFAQCAVLNQVHIADLKSWLGITFSDLTANPVYYAGKLYLNGALLESAVIPDTVTEVKAYAFYNVDSLTSVEIPTSVNAIATHAFFDCNNLASVTVPGSVQQISDCVFANCTSLKTVQISSGVTNIGVRAFSGCNQLSELAIADTVTAIGEYAFLDCAALPAVTIPNSVTSVGVSAFYGCTGVESATLSENLTTIPSGLFGGCTGLKSITIPASVTKIDGGISTSVGKVFFEGDLPEIASSAFSGITAYCYYPAQKEAYASVLQKDFGGTLVWVPVGDTETSVNCGENVTWSLSEDGTLTISGTGNMYDYSTDDSIFAPWYDQILGIEHVVIEEGVQNIGACAFHSCTALKSVSIPASVTVIEDSAFQNCGALTGVTLPEKLTAIGNAAFYKCSALTGVTLPESLISIGSTAFSNTAISRITIPDRVASIGGQAFSGCKSLRSAIIGASVTDIPNGMFSGCYELSSVVFPAGLKTIGDSAFSTCYELDTFTLPEGLTHIGKMCFAMCGFDSFTSGFSTIILPSTIQYIGDNAFWYCSDLYSVQFNGGKFTLGSKLFQQNQKTITIVFKCVAPTFSENTFGEMVYGVKAYYPSNEESWTADVLQNYGGKVTWINENMEITKPEDGTTGDGTNGDGDGSGTDTGSGEGGSGGDSGEGSGSGGESGSAGCTQHSYSAAVKKPTCTEAGYTTYTCTKCDNFYTSDYKAALGHSEVVDTGKAATCTQSGLTEGKHCSACGETLIAQEEIPETGHTYENGICSVCGDNVGPVITQQPTDSEAVLGERYMVEVKAEGEGLKYQWYFRNAGSDQWHRSGVRDNTYDDIMTKARAGREVYCVVTDVNGNTVTTETAMLVRIAAEELRITQQPTDTTTVFGERFCATVEAQGEGIKYQWYFRNDGDDKWYRSSVRDNTYDDIMTKWRMNREIYCVITDALGNTVTTDTVKLYAVPSVELTLVTQAEDSSAVMGETFCVTVEAEGDDLTYRWYFRNAGSDQWHRSGVRDNTYDDIMTKARAGREVYCVITDVWGNSITSETVKLIAVPSVELKLLEQSYESAVIGDRYCVTVNAQGDDLTYRWYFRNAGSDKWYRSSVTDNTYDDVMTKSRANRDVYCVITDALGNQVTTEVVTLVPAQ